MRMKQYTKIGLVCLGLGVGSSAHAVSIDGFPQLIDLAKNKVQTLHKLWNLGADTLKGIEHLNEGMLDVRNFTQGMKNTLGMQHGAGEYTDANGLSTAGVWVRLRLSLGCFRSPVIHPLFQVLSMACYFSRFAVS